MNTTPSPRRPGFRKSMLCAGFVAMTALSLTPALAAGAAHYYDGSRQVRITVQADLVAGFVGGPNKTSTLATGAAPLAGAGDSLVQIYHRPTLTARSTEASGLPVYREGDSPAGRLMTLPGGALVKFRPDWTREQIDKFAASHGSRVERQLDIGPNWYLLATPAGEASLTIANAMHESGEVLSASPNWWKPLRTK